MKPVILHTEESDGWGGQEIRILSEMLGMKSRGYGVLLATPGHTQIYKRAKEAGIEVIDVRMEKPGFLSGVMSLRKIIRRRDVAIINTHSSRDSWMGGIAGRLSGAKVIRTRHISSDIGNGFLTSFVYGPLCDGIMTTGEFIREQLVLGLGIDRGKIFSVPTGIDVGRFRAADGSAVRAELGLKPGDILLGTAAVLRRWKGHEYLIKAMPGILEEFPAVKLLLAGDGPYRRKIEGFIDELGLGGSVTVLGHREDIPAVIGAFDISVLASFKSEGVPQFLLQSMAAGKPVVGTAAGGIPEAVRDGVNGLIVPPKDPDAIAKAVKSLLSDPERRRRMGEAGYAMAAREHSIETMLDRIEGLYNRVLS